MPDLSKRLEKAEKLVQKGKLADAIEEYLVAWKEDPNNDSVVEIVSELYLRQGEISKSQECYGYLFDKYRERNDGPKAVLVFRKMLKIGPQEPARLLEFARLLEKSKPEEAAEQYRNAAQLFEEKGEKAQALEALMALAALDSANVDLQIRLGETAHGVGQNDVAAAAFLRAAELKLLQGAAPSALPLMERAHQLAPHDVNIAMRFARAVFESGVADKAIALLRPFLPSGATPEMMRLLADAYLAIADFSEAEEVLWQLATSTPDAYAMLFRVAEGYLRIPDQQRTIALLGRLKQAMFRAGNTRGFVSQAETLAQKDHAGAQVIEFLAGLYNELNYDSQFHHCLERLFDLYFAEGNFLKAADALERMVDVDPYDASNSQRLNRLTGKIDSRRWQAIASRFQQTAVSAPPSTSAVAEAAPAGGAAEAGAGEGESNVLEDLVLQAEIFLQYGLRPKALERLERINKLFPGEEDKNDKLRSLYSAAGLQPRRAGAAPAPAAAPGAEAAEPAADDSITDITRVTEITRNIYRQGTGKGVLFTAVNDVGRTWRVSKCLAGLCTPGKPPSAVLEYCATGMKQSDVVSIVRLVTGTQQLVADGSPLAVEDVESSAKLAPVAEVVKALGIRSLLVLPLMDADQPLGVLVLEQCDRRRRWRSNEIMVLKSIADQIVMATTHVKLRSLMKSLAVTDERTGMLNRSSYIDCLLTEVGRAQKQGGITCVLLMQFGRSGNQLVREHGEEAVRRFMDEAGQAVMSHMRQNDVAIKYDSTTLALILSDTKGQDVFFVVDKMRKLLSGIRISDAAAPPLTFGIAEALLDSGMDAVDSVTELINRAEEALAAAQKAGGNTGKLLAPVEVGA